MSLVRIFERLHQQKHRGPVILHFADGCANHVEIPGEPIRIVLDKHETVSQA